LRRRRPNFAGIFFVTLAVVVGSLAFADTRRYPNLPTRIEIEATLIPSFDNRDPSQTRFGDLEFRGGIALTSKNPAFGGVSALHVEPDGVTSSRLPITAPGCAAALSIVTENR
jgi:hypothetical protein